jgi:hypothetical protein
VTSAARLAGASLFMPFNTTSALILFQARQRLPAQVRAFELLYQKFWVTDEFLQWLLTQREAFPFLREPILRQLLNKGEAGRTNDLDLYYAALGLEDRLTADFNDRNGSEIMDFNRSLTKDYRFKETFNLVINDGSTEHLFDQKTAFENLHKLCEVDGIMTHVVPKLDVLNTSFYGYSPSFFFDLAKANHYEILDLRLANRWGDTVPVRLHEEDPVPPADFLPVVMMPGARNSVSDEPTLLDLPTHLERKDFTAKAVLAHLATPLCWANRCLLERSIRRREENAGDLFITAILRKTEDKPFVVPFQGNRLAELGTPQLRTRYQNQFEEPTSQV